jgi:hypothetical protein
LGVVHGQKADIPAFGREVHLDMPVSIVEGLRSVGIATFVVWTSKESI